MGSTPSTEAPVSRAQLSNQQKGTQTGKKTDGMNDCKCAVVVPGRL